MIDRIPRITGVAVVALLAASFGAITAHMQPRPPERSSMDSIAQQYVRLVLALGQHDADYVDAYYGPPEWKTEAQTAKLDLTMIGDRASGSDANWPRPPPNVRRRTLGRRRSLGSSGGNTSITRSPRSRLVYGC